MFRSGQFRAENGVLRTVMEFLKLSSPDMQTDLFDFGTHLLVSFGLITNVDIFLPPHMAAFLLVLLR